MKLIEFKCPSCGADLKTDASREIMYCEYCGKRLILDDESMRVRISIDNAREAGFEFEQGRMHAQSNNVRAEAEKLHRMIDALPDYERLNSRYEALDRQCREDKNKHVKIAPLLGWVALCLFLAQLISINFTNLVRYHDPSRIGVILVSAGIIALIVWLQYSKFVGNREKAENNARLRNGVKSELDALLSESGLDSVPEEYRTSECLQYFDNALVSGVALTVSQAEHNYELYRRQQELVEQNKRQLELQEQQLREMKEMRKKMKDKDDDDNALGTIAAIGLGAIVVRSIFKKW